MSSDSYADAINQVCRAAYITLEDNSGWFKSDQHDKIVGMIEEHTIPGCTHAIRTAMGIATTSKLVDRLNDNTATLMSQISRQIDTCPEALTDYNATYVLRNSSLDASTDRLFNIALEANRAARRAMDEINLCIYARGRSRTPPSLPQLVRRGGH